MLINGQSLYEKLNDMTEKERKAKFYDLFVERETLRNIVEFSVAGDIESDWTENDGPAPDLDAVEDTFDNLPDENVQTVVSQAWEAVNEVDCANQLWEDFVDEVTPALRDVLMDKLRERRQE
jgi:hypothetical protein